MLSRLPLLAAILVGALASTLQIQEPYLMGDRHQPKPDQKSPRLAASHYLNSAPLIWSFIHGPRNDAVTLVDAVPSRCGEMLEKGEVDGALVPVIEYQRIPGISLVPDVCVGSRDSVRSVVLVTRKDDLRQIRSVALDGSSRTSAALIKIVFREFVGCEPQWTSYAPDLERMLSENDAALIIGDPAMTFTREDVRIFDTASLWQEYTGLGFVFAMWMARGNDVKHFKKIDFATARDEGLARIEEIVSQYQNDIPLPREELHRYLSENIVFNIDESMEKGLHLYFELACKQGLIDKVRPLQFLDL